jgi:glycosyltransferase involved in cell wall biosynthesis
LGAVGIIEHGSSHPLFQKQILEEEYKKFGIKKSISHPKIIEKAEKEFKEADYIFLPSKFAIKSFVDKGFSKEKLLHIPYGVNLSEFKQIPKEDDVFRVVFAGGMTLQKGLHYLLQGFSELNLPNSELILLGGMTDEMKSFFRKYNVEEAINQEINKSLNQNSSRIRFLGHKKQKDLHKYYSQGSVFVLPSIQDGFGMVMIQAMACGLPIIATENTGGPDVIENNKNGFVVPIRDVGVLKEKLVYLYENPEKREKMGEEAKKTAESGFTWGDYGDKIVKEYERILKK